MHRLARTLARRVAPVLGTVAASTRIAQKDDEPKTTVFAAMPSPTTLTLLDQEDGTIALDDQNGSIIEGVKNSFIKMVSGALVSPNIAYCMDNPRGMNKCDAIWNKYCAESQQKALDRGDNVLAELHSQRLGIHELQEMEDRWIQGRATTTSHYQAAAEEEWGRVDVWNGRSAREDAQLNYDRQAFDRQRLRQDLRDAQYQWAYEPPPPVPVGAARYYARPPSQPHGRPSRGSRRSSGRRSDRPPMDPNVIFEATSTYRRDRHGNVEHESNKRNGRPLAELDASDRQRSRSRDANRGRRSRDTRRRRR